MVNCQGCGEETSSRLCCPKCSEYGRTSFFCSQECFVSSWPSHSKLHVIIRQIVLSAKPPSQVDASITSQGGGYSADDAVAVSPATTAASVSATGDEGLFRKKGHSGGVTRVHGVETHSRSRTGSRAQSETELPVVSSSAASSSFSRPAAAVVPSSSSSSATSRGHPALSPASAASSDDGGSGETAAFSKSRDSDDSRSAVGGVLSAVRNLLGPDTRAKAGEHLQGGRPAAAAATVAAARVTQAVRSVFSSSGQSRNYTSPGGIRKKDIVLGVAPRDKAARISIPVSATAAPPSGVGLCRCLVLALICVFCLFFMGLMRRILFDGVSSSSGYYTSHMDDIARNKNEAASESDDVVSAVLARIGARPYGEEISTLQASLQDIRNELAAVTTLVQQHQAVIDQFVVKPDFSGRRQGGGGGVINQAISAYLEGGPPQSDAPQLRMPLLVSSSLVPGQKGGAGLNEAASQEAVASPHSALLREQSPASKQPPQENSGVSETVGVSVQKYHDADVTAEDARVKSKAEIHQPSPANATEEKQPLKSSQRRPESEDANQMWSDTNGREESKDNGSMLSNPFKSALHSNDAAGALHPDAPLQPGEAGEVDGSRANDSAYLEGPSSQHKDEVEDANVAEQREMSSSASGEVEEAKATGGYGRASGGGDGEQKERIKRTPAGVNALTSSDYKESEEQGSGRNGKSDKKSPTASHGFSVRQAFRGGRDRLDGRLEEEKEDKVGKPGGGARSVPFGLGGVQSRGGKRAKRT